MELQEIKSTGVEKGKGIYECKEKRREEERDPWRRVLWAGWMERVNRG